MTQLPIALEIHHRDLKVWDSCAKTYEERIVGGHPDVLAYEAFEEDLLDRVLLFLARERDLTLRLFDVGCGSGRLHLRYGMKLANTALLSSEDAHQVASFRAMNHAYAQDSILVKRLISIGGVDFSSEMLAIAERKLQTAGLGTFLGSRLKFEQGSAFELQSMAATPVPVVVCVCNSIGVMQGAEGAEALFDAMKRAVVGSSGIGIISAYRREAVGAFALGNYESTMDVCGQPRWLRPDTYAGPAYKQVPLTYKRAHDVSNSIEVDIRDQDDRLIASGYRLFRDECAVKETIRTGQIRTYTDYESNWYSLEQFAQWIAERWSGYTTFHFEGRDLDALRGEPVQLAILDPKGRLAELFERLLHNRVVKR